MLEKVNLLDINFPTSMISSIVVIVVPLAMIFIVLDYINSENEIDVANYLDIIKDFQFIFFKTIAYGLFAYIIFLIYKDKEYIDITTFFTFVFSFVECMHNFCLSFGKFFVSIAQSNLLYTLIAIFIIFILFKYSSIINNINNYMELMLIKIFRKFTY